MHCRTALLVFVCGCARATHAADETDNVFTQEGPLPVFKIEVDKANLDKLRANPRAYVDCTVREGSGTYRNVGIHIKGAAGSTRDWNDKPALTLSFDRTIKSQRYRGLDKVHLNNSVQDGRYMTELIGGELMRAAGVPTARATHGFVELNGRKVGLYVVKEGYDSYFLKRHFGSSAGNLYDGGFLQDIDHPNLKRTHGDGDVEDRSDIRAVHLAARHRDLDQRFEKIAAVVDVDRFLAMAAVEALTWHWDGYAMHKNNYRVYHDLKSGKMVFIPHGMDQLWGDINGPWRPGFEGLIMRKLLDTKEGQEAYRKKVEEVLDKAYKVEEMQARIDKVLKRFKDHLEPIDKNLYADLENQNRGLKDLIKQRAEVVRRQLAAK